MLSSLKSKLTRSQTSKRSDTRASEKSAGTIKRTRKSISIGIFGTSDYTNNQKFRSLFTNRDFKKLPLEGDFFVLKPTKPKTVVCYEFDIGNLHRNRGVRVLRNVKFNLLFFVVDLTNYLSIQLGCIGWLIESLSLMYNTVPEYSIVAFSIDIKQSQDFNILIDFCEKYDIRNVVKLKSENDVIINNALNLTLRFLNFNMATKSDNSSDPSARNERGCSSAKKNTVEENQRKSSQEETEENCEFPRSKFAINWSLFSQDISADSFCIGLRQQV